MPSVLKFLYGLQTFGIKFGLENIGILLEELGNPHLRFRSVHIAGTNGKGSTAALIAAGLTASGYKTGLYTSPHLVRFNERIRINGKEIPDDVLIACTARLKKTIVRRKATFFDATTAIAFAWFAEQKIDCAVVETGLGGLYDSTNIITPLLGIITTIGLDHTQYLGKTLEEIAVQKGGIIKPGVPAVLGRMHRKAEKVLKAIARGRGSECIASSAFKSPLVLVEELGQTVADIPTGTTVYKKIKLGLTGAHQAANAAVALAALERLRSDFGYHNITAPNLRRAFNSPGQFTGLRGRIDILRASPLMIGDVAHNPQAMEMLCSLLRRIIPGRCITVFGVMRDKDYGPMIRSLRSVSRRIVAVSPDMERAMPAGELCSAIQEKGIPCIDGGSVSSGIYLAIQEKRPDEPILITGSHYVVGEAIETLNKKSSKNI